MKCSELVEGGTMESQRKNFFAVDDFVCGANGFLTSALKLLAAQVQAPTDQELYSSSVYGIEEV